MEFKERFGDRHWFLLLLLYDLLFGKNEVISILKEEEKTWVLHQMGCLTDGLEVVKQQITLTDLPVWLTENIHIYARVNYLVTDLESVLQQLGNIGYQEKGTANDSVFDTRKIEETKNVSSQYIYWRDSDLSDLLVFPFNSKIAQESLVFQRQLVIQDKASCLVAECFQAVLGWTILDACAAPGNKSMHLISKALQLNGKEFYKNPIRIIAVDRDKERFMLMKRMIRQCQYDTLIDAYNRDFLQMQVECQGIILDPSCSGSGLVKRNVVDSYETNYTQRIQQLAAFQKKMLEHALCNFPNCVRVVYSTCSIHKEENEMVVFDVLQQTQGLGWRLKKILPNWPRRGWKVPLDEEQADCCVRTDPKTDHTNGFFIACFERDNSQLEANSDRMINSSIKMQNALNLLGLGSSCSVMLLLDGAEERKTAVVYSPTTHKKLEELPLFEETETVSGKVVISLKEGKTLQHLGIRIEFIGAIEMLYDKESSQEFTSLVRELDDPGILTGTKQYPFAFTHVEKSYDTYNGVNVRLRYFVRVTIERPTYVPNIVKEYDVAVQHVQQEPQVNNAIRMEVGIEDSLHIEFEYKRSKLHLNDVVLGKVSFLQVRIKIKRMELEVKRRESAGTGIHAVNETDTLAKFEIMDGSPVRGESIPVRMFLSAYPSLTPTYKNVNNKFSVKYFLNLVLVDEDDRRYFKQHEIFLWRADKQ
eukprot:jgi/Galph1/3428/GphlegSOOS_G2080.1